MHVRRRNQAFPLSLMPSTASSRDLAVMVTVREEDRMVTDKHGNRGDRSGSGRPAQGRITIRPESERTVRPSHRVQEEKERQREIGAQGASGQTGTPGQT